MVDAHSQPRGLKNSAFEKERLEDLLVERHENPASEAALGSNSETNRSSAIFQQRGVSFWFFFFSG